jgi:hypothetical protein
MMGVGVGGVVNVPVLTGGIGGGVAVKLVGAGVGAGVAAFVPAYAMATAMSTMQYKQQQQPSAQIVRVRRSSSVRGCTRVLTAEERKGVRTCSTAGNNRGAASKRPAIERASVVDATFGAL